MGITAKMGKVLVILFDIILLEPCNNLNPWFLFYYDNLLVNDIIFNFEKDVWIS